jgi:hypothetical protein
MKRAILSIIFALHIGAGAIADERMWLPMLVERLNYTDMQKEGLQLTPEELYSINNSSLKDAIVNLGGGFCTGDQTKYNYKVITPSNSQKSKSIKYRVSYLSK